MIHRKQRTFEEQIKSAQDAINFYRFYRFNLENKIINGIKFKIKIMY